LATASATALQLKPLADRVVVRKLEAEEKTAGGIVLPDTAKEKPQQGEVLAVGPGRVDDKGNRVPMELKKGEKVLFAKYSGTEVKYEGVEYLILSERDILAIVG
jgi:chaperonin GroES